MRSRLQGSGLASTGKALAGIGLASDQHELMSSTRAARRSLLALVLASAIYVGVIAWPFITALFLAAVFAAALWPAQQKLTARLRGRRAVSALLLVLASVVVVGGPVVAFGAVAVQQGAEAVRYGVERLHSEGVTGLIERLPDPLDRIVLNSLEGLANSDRVDASVQQVAAGGGRAAAAVGTAITATGSVLFQTVMMMIAFFFLLVDGDRLVAWVDDVSPLERGRTLELFQEVRRVSSSVIFSSLVTATVQSGAALVGYLIASVPHPVFVTGITFVVAFIPAIGAGSVALVVALFMWLAGHPYAALFLAIWALTVVSLIDNLLRPFLIKGDIRMHGAVVFFALIGGIGIFGVPGLLLGPLIVALFLATLCIYRRDYEA